MITNARAVRSDSSATHRWIALCLACLLLLAACGDGGADGGTTDAGDDADAEDTGQTWDLRFATFFGPNAPYARNFERYRELVEERTDGRVAVEVLGGEALLPAPEILPGVGDGRADMGYSIDSFSHAELPLTSIASVPFITANAVAHMRTFWELYNRNDDFRAEWDDMNVRVLFFQAGGPSMLGTSDEPAASVDDIAGLRIRALGFINSAIDQVGGLPQPLPFPEIYESVQRGLIDGYALQFDLIGEAALPEVAPHVVDAGLGQYVLPSITINLDVWNSMPSDIQDTLLEAGEEAMDEIADDILESGEITCDMIEENDGSATVWDDAEVAEWRDAVFDDLLADWQSQVEAAGLDADAFYEDFTSTLEEYEETETFADPLHTCAERLG